MHPASNAKRRIMKWGGLFVAATFMGLYSFSTYTTSELADRARPKYARLFAQEMTGLYTALMLLPALLWFIPRFPIARDNWVKRLPMHVAASAAFGACHTLLMWGSRSLLFPILGFGPYDYGRIGARFLMEYQKQAIIYAFLYVVLTLIAATRRNRERELRASQLEKQLAEARLNALTMQLNPHFLFNTLNMISSLIYEDVRAADRMIASLSDLLRLTLNHADRQEVPLHKELEFLESYLAIMKARFQERLEVTIDVDPAVRDWPVPTLILQPLVENSIKHAMADHARPGSIGVTVRRERDGLKLAVQDNGPGMDCSVEIAMNSGVGLSNTRRRLQELYGAAQRFEIQNVPDGGLRVAMEIPARGRFPGDGAKP